MKIILFDRLPSLNETIKVAKSHPQAYANLKRKHTQNIAWAVRSQIKRPVKPPVEILFSWFTKDRRVDPDNLVSAKKYILDGCIASGILGNDDWNHISGFRDTWTVDKLNPRIEVEIKEATL